MVMTFDGAGGRGSAYKQPVRSGMTREQQQYWYRGSSARRSMLYAGALLMMLSSTAAQDIRGLEVCTAEKQMERRTGCLQANVELLQQALTRLTRETQDKMAATSRDVA